MILIVHMSLLTIRIIFRLIINIFHKYAMRFLGKCPTGLVDSFRQFINGGVYDLFLSSLCPGTTEYSKCLPGLLIFQVNIVSHKNVLLTSVL